VFMARILEAGQVRAIRAIAVDEHTAVLLERDGKSRVAGTGFAYFLKASAKPSVCRPGTPLTFTGIAVVKAQAGMQFDTARWSGDGSRYALSVERGTIHSTQPGGAIY
jgi:cyanophycinase-like exopeptidase